MEYRLDGRGSNPGRATYFSLFHRVQTGSEAKIAFYPVTTGHSIPWGKAADE
jgi:hypothetical protein